jgi:hypothetical protein
MGTLKNIKDGWMNFVRANENYDNLPENVRVMAEERAEICKVCPELTESGILFQVVERLMPNGSGTHKMRKKFDPESGEKGDVVKGYKCGVCGCAFPANVMAPGKDCPKDKWPKKK